jgi:phosphodiesterase/alkaline phosphatase D-like protein
MRTVTRTVVVVVAGLSGALGLAPAVAFAGPYENKCEASIEFCKEVAGSNPAGVAVDNSAGASKGDVYVVALSSHKLVKYSAAGKELSSVELGETTPIWDAVDSSAVTPGDIYVGLFGTGEVVKYDPSGTLLAGFKVTGLTNPSGVGVDPRNGNVYVAERAGNVKVYNGSTGAEVAGESWSDGIKEAGSLAVDKKGDVYAINEFAELVEFPVGTAAEREANRKVIDSNKPYSVAIDPSTGEIFVFNTTPVGEIVVYNEKGELTGEAFGPGEFGAQGSAGLGVSAATHDVYASNFSGNDNLLFAPGTGAPEPLLSVERLGSGSGEVTSTDGHIKCGSECKHKYPENEKVTLEAHASAGSAFVKWEHCTSETAGKCEVTVTAAVTVTATFSEAAGPPLVQALAATGITRTAATLRGSVNPDHETPVACAFHYALEESLAGATVKGCTPAAETLGSGNTPVPVSATIEGLAPNTTYYYRLTAANGTGASESEPTQQLLTLPNPPVVATGSPSALTPTSATLAGTVNPGSAGHSAQDDTTYRFQYSTDESFSASSTVADAGEGTSAVPVQASLHGLEPGTTYHYRLIAQNNNDKTSQQVTGEPQTFTTIPTPPALTGAGATQITASSALITTTLETQGLPTRWELQLGTSPAALQYQAAGNTASPEPQPIGAQLEHLQPGVTYYYRLIAESPDGTGETGILAFTTTAPPPASGGAVAAVFPLLTVPPNAFPSEAPTPVVHALTTKQKLQNALKACRRKHNRHKRATCEKQAHHKYKVK